ncbi:hypothetical protein [Streptomyces sp. NPDC051577]|uniref:hypothetical protein n=1 Tax=Streptomyces sp. NPDC051577 TaxID=3155166 RepID=UPI0034289EF7
MDAALQAKLPAKIRDAGFVRVATDVPYPPFKMYATAGGGKMTGIASAGREA